MTHILMVEPDAILSKVYKAALTLAGYRVCASSAAEDAIKQIDNARPDVIVLELQMPGHNGVEFLHEFRSYPEWQHLPVILHTLVTPHNLQVQMPRLSQLGVVKYLYKPATNLRQLVFSVGEVLDVA